MKNKIISLPLCLCVAMLFSSLSGASAASITNNASGLSLTNPAAWFGGVVPGASDVGFFDSTSGAGGALGGSLSWAGIDILNPATPITISSTTTNAAIPAALTLGASGIDMTLAANNLTVSNGVVVNANQSWFVTNGAALTVAGVISGTGLLNLNNAGTMSS